MELIGPGGGCIVAWIVIGWYCGTGPRIIVLPPGGGPIGPQPGDPPVKLEWAMRVALGMVGAMIGGYLFHEILAVDHADPAGILVTFVGAFTAGRISVDLGGLLVPRMASR